MTYLLQGADYLIGPVQAVPTIPELLTPPKAFTGGLCVLNYAHSNTLEAFEPYASCSLLLNNTPLAASDLGLAPQQEVTPLAMPTALGKSGWGRQAHINAACPVWIFRDPRFRGADPLFGWIFLLNTVNYSDWVTLLAAKQVNIFPYLVSPVRKFPISAFLRIYQWMWRDAEDKLPPLYSTFLQLMNAFMGIKSGKRK